MITALVSALLLAVMSVTIYIAECAPELTTLTIDELKTRVLIVSCTLAILICCGRR